MMEYITFRTCKSHLMTSQYLFYLSCVFNVRFSASTQHWYNYFGLSTFPGDVPTTATALWIEDNVDLQYVDDTGDMPVLDFCSLERNGLIEFPNLAKAPALASLYLTGNRISHVAPERLDVLTNLVLLKLG